MLEEVFGFVCKGWRHQYHQHLQISNTLVGRNGITARMSRKALHPFEVVNMP